MNFGPRLYVMVVWLNRWCLKHDCRLHLDGRVGFLRKCVGISKEGRYIELNDWHMEGVPESPEDAYHKDDVLVVLGRGAKAVTQLYTWLKAYDKAGFTPVFDYREDHLGNLISIPGYPDMVWQMGKVEESLTKSDRRKEY